MKSKISNSLVVVVLAIIAGLPMRAEARREKIEKNSRDPYISAMIIDAESGQILFIDNPDTPVYPASILKLMALLIILEKAQSGELRLQDQVWVTAEAARIGGSQVYLKEKESFTIDELLYALMVQSANDAATALAIHVAGSKDAFVAMMNRRAAELGMKNTQFYTVHGLPPNVGQKADVSTARDLVRLARVLLNYPDALRYTSTRERGFRNNTFIMRTHNPLLGSWEGCDGMKTGYFTAAGYSIVATASRGGSRIIVAILGSLDRKTRDAKAAELLARGFRLMPKKEIVKSITNAPPVLEEELAGKTGKSVLGISVLIAVLAVALVLAGYYIYVYARRREREENQ